MNHRSVVVGEYCSQDHAPSPKTPVVHAHGSLAVVLRGRGVMHMGSAWRVHPGDVFLVPEGAPHYRVDTEPVGVLGMQLCMGCVPSSRWGPALRGLFTAVAQGASPILKPKPDDQAELEHTLRALQDDRLADWERDARMGVLTACLTRSAPSAVRKVDAEGTLVGQAMSWIGEHGMEAISLVDVAAAVGRAPTHLAARVKAETGRTVGDWITHTRMAHARSLLLTCDDAVEQVAERIGYRSPSHFHRTFRRVHGMPPAAWRQHHRTQRS